jgi:FlaG/FlaF family flagellin (archaellin)
VFIHGNFFKLSKHQLHMENHPSPTQHDEIDLLDLLVTIAENIKLLILGPLLAGLLVFVGLTMQPKPNQQVSLAKATFAIGPQKLLSPQDLIPKVTASTTLDQAGQLLKADGHTEALQWLKTEHIIASIPKDTSLMSVVVQAEQEGTALLVAKAVLEATLLGTQPQGAALDSTLQAQEKDLALLTNARTVEAKLANYIRQRTNVDAVLVQSYESIAKMVPSIASRVDQRRMVLRGLSIADVVQQPQLLPQKHTPAKPRTMQFTLVAVLASGFALLLFVFIRQAFRNAGNNPESAAKLVRIRKALALRSSKA